MLRLGVDPVSRRDAPSSWPTFEASELCHRDRRLNTHSSIHQPTHPMHQTHRIVVHPPTDPSRPLPLQHGSLVPRESQRPYTPRTQASLIFRRLAGSATERPRCSCIGTTKLSTRMELCGGALEAAQARSGNGAGQRVRVACSAVPRSGRRLKGRQVL
jgi:hypothetical protein